MEVDHRIAARRRQVAEVHARSAFTKLIWGLVLAVTAALTVWLFRSPVLAVSSISVSGFEAAAIQSILLDNGVEPGRPLVTVRPGTVAQALLADPHILTADVTLDWPQTVVIDIEPRVPVAWANLGGSWGKVGIDGVVIETATEPAAGLPILEVPWHRAESGATEPSSNQPSSIALGGLEFLGALDVLVAQQTVVIARGDELWAMLPNVSVRLGRPIDMIAKAAALEAVLAQGVEMGSTVNLLAPTRPAVLTPGAVLLLEDQSGTEGTAATTTVETSP